MTPLELFGLICVLAVLRLALTVRAPQIARVREPLPADGHAGSATTVAPSTLGIVREYLDAFIVAGLVALFLITFVVRTFFIPSGSMEPTLQIHDVLLVNEFEYRFAKPHDGDIVVFTPATPSPNDFIKRLIAGPGDQLRVHNGIVYRNGEALVEPYILSRPAYELEIKNYGIYVDGTRVDSAYANVPPRALWSAPDRVPDNCYFMMGDNRNNSEDSHVWGFAQLSGKFYSGTMKDKNAGFTGHAFLLFWPLNRIRILK